LQSIVATFINETKVSPDHIAIQISYETFPDGAFAFPILFSLFLFLPVPY
jgi:hypothetical protein